MIERYSTPVTHSDQGRNEETMSIVFLELGHFVLQLHEGNDAFVTRHQ